MNDNLLYLCTAILEVNGGHALLKSVKWDHRPLLCSSCHFSRTFGLKTMLTLACYFEPLYGWSCFFFCWSFFFFCYFWIVALFCHITNTTSFSLRFLLSAYISVECISAFTRNPNWVEFCFAESITCLRVRPLIMHRYALYSNCALHKLHWL